MFDQIRYRRNALALMLAILSTSVTVFAGGRSALHRSISVAPAGASALTIPTSFFKVESIAQSEDSSIHIVFNVIIDDRATEVATALLNGIQSELRSDTLHVAPADESIRAAGNPAISEFFEKPAKKYFGRMTVMIPSGSTIAIQGDNGRLVRSGAVPEAVQELIGHLKGQLFILSLARDTSEARLSAANQLQAVTAFLDAQEKSVHDRQALDGVLSVSEIAGILLAIGDRDVRIFAASRLSSLVFDSERPLLRPVLQRCFSADVPPAN